jgi:hypothetical protein
VKKTKKTKVEKGKKAAVKSKRDPGYRGIVNLSGAKTKVVVAEQQALPLKVEASKPTLEQLSERARVELKYQRSIIEQTAQREYEKLKYDRVKQLAQEAGLEEKFIIAHIDSKEEIRIK